MPKVIVQLVGGEEKVGEVLAFNANQPAFHLQEEKEGGRREARAIGMNMVRTIRFLKKEDMTESRLRTETIDQSTFAGTVAFKLMVEFKDGSVLNGTAIRYSPNDKGFFLIPLNPADKSERIYVNANEVKKVDAKRLLGKILVDQKKISDQQLHEGLNRQREHREKKIGTILRENALISDEQLEESLRKQREQPKLLGEILLEAGYITPEQLENALHIQHENKKKKLGQILVELKYLTPNDICIALATQCHCHWIDLSDVRIPPDVATSLPEDIVKKLEVIPVERRDDKVLVVATSQPQDPHIGEEIRKSTSLTVEMVAAYEVYIDEDIHLFFPDKD